jgi:hypothetical protein
MPRVKTFSEKYNKTETSNNEILESQLTTNNNNQEVTEIMDNLTTLNNGNNNGNNFNYDEIKINLNQDELTTNLNLLSDTIGIKSGVLVEKILNEVLLSQDDNFYLIKLFRNILQEQKVKVQAQNLKALEDQKAIKLLEYKRLEVESLAYSLR